MFPTDAYIYEGKLAIAMYLDSSILMSLQDYKALGEERRGEERVEKGEGEHEEGKQIEAIKAMEGDNSVN